MDVQEGLDKYVSFACQSARTHTTRHDSTAARGTSVCRIFTIAHVNAALLRKELDVVSVCLRTYHLCESAVVSTDRERSETMGTVGVLWSDAAVTHAAKPATMVMLVACSFGGQGFALFS